MKKIRAKHHDNDRIVCLNPNGFLDFYYQPQGSEQRVFMFRTDYSQSVSAYFRLHGKALNDQGLFITLRQLYSFDEYRNQKLGHVFERIPLSVEYCIKYELDDGKDAEPLKKAE